ncbi:MAG: peptide-methionine (S)-S-oxide reductase MsrA [Saprospiraceae bacterium]
MKKIFFSLLMLGTFVISACSQQKSMSSNGKKVNDDVAPVSEYVKANPELKDYAVATFAGGCFWCTEASFERINGVVDVISGYSGGEKDYPTYYEVGSGETNYAEAIDIFYDPKVIDYQKLLEVFFVAHDPTTLNRQGPDVGPQYRSAIFYHDDEQKKLAEDYIEHLDESRKYADPIVTQVAPYAEFWVAEGYHQNYYEIHPTNRYVQAVSRPKVEKVMKTFKDILKPEYKNK